MDRGPTPSDAELTRIARDLANAIEGEIRFGRHDRMLYATDASLYQVEPLGVVVPASIDDAARAIEFCRDRGLPILPRGGGTSLAGQCVNRAVIIDFSPRCRAVVGIDPSARRCRVEPGITVDELNDRLAGHGLFFAPDPATTRQANIGGCIGNNAAGARSIRYGRTSENLAGIDACLADGRRVRFERGTGASDPAVRELTIGVLEVVHRHAERIRARFPKTIRRNAGYGLDVILAQSDSAGPRAETDAILKTVNLAPLLCGSEGTLAVTLGAELLLHPLPKAKGLALASFADLDAAIDAVAPILTTGPSAIELLDDTILDLAAANPEYAGYAELIPRLDGARPSAVLYVEYFADGGAELGAKFRELRRVVPDAAIVELTAPGDMARAWALRKAGEPLLHGMPGARKPITFVEDNAVPVERLGEFVRRFRAIVARHGTRAAYWAHASVGVLHVRPFLDIHDPADRARLEAIAIEVADLARDLGGVMSGEHGDGRVRGPLLERFFGPELVGAFGQIKALFDPRNLLNPGNIVTPSGAIRPIPAMVTSLRVNPEGREARVPSAATFFEYADQHGFAGAVEMCNGAGVCRKTSGGTMCPSYRATLDERHSTRGRGNALRLAITGQLARGDSQAWNDPDTIATLDLCLSCKGCKGECPSNVDIARLKAEFTAQRYARDGAPLSARVLGNIRVLNRLGALAPGLANRLNRARPIRALMRRALGISPSRSIPEFAPALTRGFGRASRDPGPDAPIVLLYADCFTTYNEPNIGHAARRVLESFGYRVRLVDAGCCGRALISMGLLREAIAAIESTFERLSVAASDPKVRAIVACEPSCASAIRDDWLDLRLRAGTKHRRDLAARCFLPEEFLERFWDEHPTRPVRSVPASDARPLVLHAHCHQKALWGAETSAALVRRLVGPVEVLDSGCCGMAGSFGYADHRYELSMRIGELSLFPAVRRAGPSATILAPGTSCRHQIKDGVGVTAIHPVELIDAVCSEAENDARGAGVAGSARKTN